jgi:hypothetical protein
MKKTTTLFFLFIILISSNKSGYSQKCDYKIMRDSITKLSCKPHDSLVVVHTNFILRNIDTNLIDTNLDLYYSDLAWSYYRLYLIQKDTSFIRRSIENYIKADQRKPNGSTTYWQLAFLYYLMDDCKQGKYYLEKFKSVTDKQYWREDQIKKITKDC